MRYMNPGYKEWVSVINNSANIANITEATKSKTGVAFYNTNRGNFILLDFPASGEVFCRFDFYCSGAGNPKLYFGEWGDGLGPYNGFYLEISGYALRLLQYIKDIWAPLLDNVNITNFDIKQGEINSVLFHLRWTDSESGFMELTINDSTFPKVENIDLTPYDNSKLKFIFLSETTMSPISNIIISDEPISIKEQVVALPIINVDTDMAYDSATGIYKALVGGQYLLATVNVADLISTFGRDSKVTGIAVVGNPAYRTDEDLTSFTALTKENNTVTEHSVANIPTESSVVASSFKVSSDTTVADLQNMQIGLKVGS